MTTREKLALYDEIKGRNDERISKYMETAGVHRALEVHAKGIIDTLDTLAYRYGLPRAELLEALVATLYATDLNKSQERNR